MSELMITMRILKDLKEYRDMQQEILDIEIRRIGNGCPFDPIAKCNLIPGEICSRVDCPVWLSMGDVNDNQNM